MICKAAWIPARGTVHIGESNEAFNPTIGALSFTSSSPAETAINDSKRTTEQTSAQQPRSASAKEILSAQATPLETLLNVASMCNVAKVFEGDEGWTARGDPTECAIQVLAHRFEWGRERWTTGSDAKWSKPRT